MASRNTHININTISFKEDDWQKTFTRIFKKYFRPLCLFSGRYLLDKENAEDVVEELLTRVWQKQIEFKDEDHLKAYLYKATYNASINARKSVSSGYERQRHFLEEGDPYQEDYQQGVITAEVMGELYRAIRNLPPQCAQVIEMSFVQGKNNNEIAKEMNLSLQTVKNYKKRGIEKLKGTLSKDALWLLLTLYFTS